MLHIDIIAKNLFLLQAKTLGTQVTLETFTVWKTNFDMERLAKLGNKAKLIEGKLTGRQLFEKDKDLWRSDLAFLEGRYHFMMHRNVCAFRFFISSAVGVPDTGVGSQGYVSHQLCKNLCPVGQCWPACSHSCLSWCCQTSLLWSVTPSSNKFCLNC